MAEAEIVAWHADVGDEIKEDQPLVDVMTEKATVEIGAPVSGKIVRRQGKAGDVAAVGTELVAIATEERESMEAPRPARPQAAKPDVDDGPAGAAGIAAPPKSTDAPPRHHAGTRPLAAPAVRARAAALGIDLAAVEGKGPGGQIRHEDLDALLLRGERKEPARAAPVREGSEEIRVIGLRRQIAQTMQQAKRRIPHFTYVEEVDLTALEALRRDVNETQTEGWPRLTLLPFLIRGLVQVLPHHPGINAHFDDEAGIIRRYGAVHVGVATQTPRGLLVPVIRNAETLELADIASGDPAPQRCRPGREGRTRGPLGIDHYGNESRGAWRHRGNADHQAARGRHRGRQQDRRATGGA